MNRIPVLYLLVGGIASGKSTIASILSAGIGAETGTFTQRGTALKDGDVSVICPDDIREKLTGNAGDQSVNDEAWGIAYRRLEGAMLKRQNVIFDAAYMVKRKTRRRMREMAVNFGYRIVYVILPLDLNEALAANAGRERTVPEDVVRRYHQNFEREFPFTVTDTEE